MKNILEPILKADFYPVSFGFRPGRSVHGALEYLRILLRPNKVRPNVEHRLPYQWAIEGDIKGCFDNIDHHALMVRVRRRMGDTKVTRLVLAFLKAGVLSEGQFSRTTDGTPRGGILSPLLANIALSAIEERYERQVWPRRTPTLRTEHQDIVRRANESRNSDRRRGLPVFFPIRYADDFIILVSVPPGPKQSERAREVALREKAELATFLKEKLHLELSEAKTLVTPVTEPMRFLGHHVRARVHPVNGELVSTTVIPKEKSQRLREMVKGMFRRSSRMNNNLGTILQRLNPILRGWCNFYRHTCGAKHVFHAFDHYIWWTILRWIKKKHPRTNMRFIRKRYGWRKPAARMLRWRDGNVMPFEMSSTKVEPFWLAWLKPPAYRVNIYGEPGA